MAMAIGLLMFFGVATAGATIERNTCNGSKPPAYVAECPVKK